MVELGRLGGTSGTLAEFLQMGCMLSGAAHFSRQGTAVWALGGSWEALSV